MMKAQKKRSHGKVPLTLLAGAVVWIVAGCDSPPTEPSSTSATPTAEADRGPDLATYCETICERTSRCGVELAKREAGTLDGELVGEMEKDLPAETKKCVDECGAVSIDDAQRFQMERAQVCLGKTDCDELSACMAAL